MPLDVAPIYCAEQIELPEDLPDILKEWSKSVLRANIESKEQLYAFSAEYFGNLSAAAGTEPNFIDLEDKVPYVREAFRMMQDAFYSIDTDQGGSIDVKELQGMWHQMGVELDKNVLDAMFAEADVDTSGKITLAEFLSSTSMWITANEAAESFAGITALRNSFDWISSAFRLFDPTGSGTVKKQDLSAVLSQIGVNISNNEIAKNFGQFMGDYENRTDITFKEFLIGLFLQLTKD